MTPCWQDLQIDHIKAVATYQGPGRDFFVMLEATVSCAIYYTSELCSIDHRLWSTNETPTSSPESSIMAIKKVALLGANGKLGPAILDALLARDFEVTVLKRESSRSPDDYPAGVKVAKIPDQMEIERLTEVLRGQDALVVTISMIEFSR